MAICTSCGRNVPDGNAFCTNCGARMTYTAGAPASPSGFGGFAGSDWDGGVLETIAASIVCSLITTITCGFGLPWGVCYLYKFIIEHTKIDGKRLRFDGTGGELFGNWIVWFILTVVTCGIYGFWVTPKLYKWIASHTHFE